MLTKNGQEPIAVFFVLVVSIVKLRDAAPVARESRGRDSGFGMSDSGFGMSDSGFGMSDSG
jgi:hypothetical protein